MQRPWSGKEIILLLGIIITYMFSSYFSYDGFLAYIVPSACWLSIALFSTKIYGLKRISTSFNGSLTVFAVLVAAIQIVSLIFVAFFTGFGRSPYNPTLISMVLNLLYFSSRLLGIEIARAQFVRSFPRNRVMLGIVLTTLFFTFINFTLIRWLNLYDPLETIRFIGSSFLPTIAQGIFSTYLALLGGPTASIAYMGTLQAFEIFSPILPNPDWTIKTMIITLVSSISFLFINETVKPFKLYRVGLLSRKDASQKSHNKKNKGLSFGWITIAVTSLLIFWSNSGLLGFQPSIVMSGSMRPIYDVGDMVIVTQTDSTRINVGDIIQYRRIDTSIIHRVIDKYTENGQTWFITKGDANDIKDAQPVNEHQVLGKALFLIPKLGWASITIRETATKTFDAVIYFNTATTNLFFSILSNIAYPLTALTIVIFSYTIVISTKKKKMETKT